MKRKLFNGISFGCLWFLIYSTYGFAFWFGVSFVFDGKYTAGQMTTVCMFTKKTAWRVAVHFCFAVVITSFYFPGVLQRYGRFDEFRNHHPLHRGLCIGQSCRLHRRHSQLIKRFVCIILYTNITNLFQELKFSG